MVLDVKAMTWAAQNGIDTPQLKAAKVPLYGKWYFPELPARVPLINLATGERRVFAEPMLAGEVVWVAEAELRRAGLGGLPPLTEEEVAEQQAKQGGETIVVEEAEPLMAVSRPVGRPPYVPPVASPAVPIVQDIYAPPADVDPASIHLPLSSIAPLVLAFGISIALLGLVISPIVLVVGLIWSAIGAAGWIRIGLLELNQAGHHGEH